MPQFSWIVNYKLLVVNKSPEFCGTYLPFFYIFFFFPFFLKNSDRKFPSIKLLEKALIQPNGWILFSPEPYILSQIWNLRKVIHSRIILIYKYLYDSNTKKQYKTVTSESRLW